MEVFQHALLIYGIQNAEMKKKCDVITSELYKPRTLWPTESEIFMQLLSFLFNFLQDAHIIFPKNVNFEIAYKTCSIMVWGAFPT